MSCSLPAGAAGGQGSRRQINQSQPSDPVKAAAPRLAACTQYPRYANQFASLRRGQCQAWIEDCLRRFVRVESVIASVRRHWSAFARGPRPRHSADAADKIIELRFPACRLRVHGLKRSKRAYRVRFTPDRDRCGTSWIGSWVPILLQKSRKRGKLGLGAEMEP